MDPSDRENSKPSWTRFSPCLKIKNKDFLEMQSCGTAWLACGDACSISSTTKIKTQNMSLFHVENYVIQHFKLPLSKCVQGIYEIQINLYLDSYHKIPNYVCATIPKLRRHLKLTMFSCPSTLNKGYSADNTNREIKTDSPTISHRLGRALLLGEDLLLASQRDNLNLIQELT